MIVGKPPANSLYFYPRSPCGERPLRSPRIALIVGFLSTLSLRRATAPNRHPCPRSKNFYPRSPCGERLMFAGVLPHDGGISIHALLAESDLFKNHFFFCHNLFLSTLSLRRATGKVSSVLPGLAFLSTLSLRRATAKVHKTVGHFCAYETNFMEIASSC